MRGAQCTAVNLQARDPAAEVPSVAASRAHARWVVGAQSDPADGFPSDFTAVDEQFRNPRALIVRGTDEVPDFEVDLVALNRGGELSVAGYEPRENHRRPDHPEMHAEAIGSVVEDRSHRPVRIDPGQYRDGVACVQPALVRKLDETVGAAFETERAARTAVWSSGRPDVCHAPLRVLAATDIAGTEANVERVKRQRRRETCEEHSTNRKVSHMP